MRPLCGLVFAFSALVACSNSDQSKSARAQLSECRDGWHEILPLQPSSGTSPDELVWRNDNLYFEQWTEETEPHFVRMPDSGGDVVELSEQGGRALFVDDESLFFSIRDRLYSVPIAGGVSTLVNDGQMFSLDEPLGKSSAFAKPTFDGTFLYFILMRFDEPRWSVWRTPRDAGVSEQLATLPDSFGASAGLVVLTDHLLVSNVDGEAFLVPKAGGDVKEFQNAKSKRPNAGSTRYLGADESGVVWAVGNRPKGADRVTYDIVLITPAGGVRDLWKDQPASFEPYYAWTDSQGGRVLSGFEEFADGERHASVWSLDAKGEATRIACDDASERDGSFVSAAALSDRAAFLVESYFDKERSGANEGESGSWHLVRVER